MALLRHVVASGFADKAVLEYFVLEEDPAALLERVMAFEPAAPALAFDWGPSAF
jgi:hypothetical protein